MKIRFLVLLLLPALLTGCTSATYVVLEPATDGYYQDQAGEVARGVYYGHRTARYSDMGIYPWWSIDYFYLGYHPYSHWSFGYYSPFFYPYYFSVFYSPWRWRHHYWNSGFYAWYDPFWHHRYSRHFGGMYAGGRGSSAGMWRRTDEHHSDRDVVNRSSLPRQSTDTAGRQRRITVAPSSGSSRHGMAILSPVSQKIRPVRLDPVRSSGLSATVIPSSAAPAPKSRLAPSPPVSSRSATSPRKALTPTRSGSNRATATPTRASRHSTAGRSRDYASPDSARSEREHD